MANRYPFNIEWSEEDQEYVATCPAFPGLSAFGASEEEALKEGKIALAGFIETCEANNLSLPEPAIRAASSGKLQLRLPKSLHGLATRMAALEDVSLNTYIADAVRARVAGEQVAKPIIEELRRQFAATRTEVASVMTVVQPAEYVETTREIYKEHTVVIPSSKERRTNH
ncbi:MAG TPA: toxin-antitoxin system HicB family antitoxin [Pyrinomonadaceae bacterium]|nr:toxin-antitoxin system HicB family antitoxin [Pyrinomonadaceae bacterium]